jgi:hypothetical protein
MPLLFEALRDLAELALGCKSCSSGAPVSHSLPDSRRMGGLVYLSSKNASLHVGVLASPEDCSLLAVRLLGQVADADLPESLVRGAMCELAYLLAGGVKRRLGFVGAMSVGLPAFFEGTPRPRSGWDTRMTHVELDAIRATLVSVTRSDHALLL